MATNTELLQEVLTAAGGDSASLPDNLITTLLKAIVDAISEGGLTGEKGADGVGISTIAQTTTSTADGGSNVFTVTLTNGQTATFTVKNGSKGSTGNAGANGSNGAPGKSAYQYAQDGGYTGTEEEFASMLAQVVATPI